MVRIGFIGAGNMGGAIISALISKGVCKKSEIIAADKVPAALERAKREWKIKATSDIAEAVTPSDIVFLSVKPQDVEKTLHVVKSAWSPEKILISICAGVTIATIQNFLGKENKIVRVMPNTPCMVGRMAAGYAPNSNVTEQEAEAVGKILGSAGVAYKFSEDSLDAVTGLSGSGPAYVAYLIKEFARAGEQVNLPADVSYGLALQTFIGTGHLLAEKKLSPDTLIKMVTSPNGTTWAGRQILEKSDIPDVLTKTVIAGTVRSKELGAAAAAAAKKPRSKL